MGRKTLTIIVEPATFTITRDGSVVGNIFFKLNGAFFPDYRWSDFPVPILSWWVEAVLHLISGDKKEEELLFMDGPQFVGVTALGSEMWGVTFLRGLTERQPEPPYSPIEGNGSRQAKAHEYDVSVNPLIASLLEATDAVISECAKRDFRSDDIAELRPLRDRLANSMGNS